MEENNRSRQPGPSIRATELVKVYGKVRALDGFSLEIPAGSIHGLLGPNGAGKSTAVRALTTLTDFDSGTAEVAGFNVREQSAKVRRRIGLVGQAAAVDEILGGRQNLVMFARLFGLSTRQAQRRADELLEIFDLQDAAARPVRTYSGGMRRRLDIAASTILDPQVLFLDEPTTGLDPRGRIDVWAAVTDIAERGTTVLLTTQHLDEADKLADQISIMNNGRVIAQGSPAELKRERGGDRIEITLATPTQAERVSRALGTDGLRPTQTAAESAVVHRPAPNGTSDLIEVLRLLDAAGVVPDDLMLRRPTLDEVFLTLTEKAVKTDTTAKES